jgi:hypothetical protein
MIVATLFVVGCQALLNLGSSDPSLRSAAYNLLCALTQTFDLKIEGQLLETNGGWCFNFCMEQGTVVFGL